MIAILLTLLLIAATAVSAAANSVIAYKNWRVCFTPDEELAYSIASCELTDAEITIPDYFDGINVIGIEPNAFNQCSTISILNCNQTIKFIGKYTFFKCLQLTTVNLNSTLCEIGKNAFEGTSSLKKINLENTQVKEISDSSFLLSGIESIELPDGCESIADYAFAQCSSLTKVVIPASVTSISDTAFLLSDNVVIYAPGDSFAVEYAAVKGIQYVSTDNAYMVGDADNDGVISIGDVTQIQRVLAELDDDADGMIAKRGAITDVTMSIFDATKIQRWLAHFEDADPRIGTIIYV